MHNRIVVATQVRGVTILALTALLLPLCARGVEPAARQFEAEKKQLEAETRAFDAEETAIKLREVYFARKKVEQEKEHARLKGVHADLQKEKTQFATFRKEYQARKKRFEMTKFATKKEWQAERTALSDLAKKGKAMVAAFNSRNATYKVARQGWITTDETLRKEYDQFTIRKKKHLQVKADLQTRRVILDKRVQSALAEAAKTAEPDKKAAANLRKLQEALARTDATLKWLSRAAWLGSVLGNNEDLVTAKKGIDKLREPVTEIKRAADKLHDLQGERKKKEAKSLLDMLKLSKLSAQEGELARIGQKISDIPTGLVSEAADEKFKVSGKLLRENPQTANKRFRSYLAAMQTNISHLKKQLAALEEISTRSRSASKVLMELNSRLEKAIRAGLFTKPLVEQYLDIDKLTKAYNEVAAAAESKTKQIRQVLPAEQRRHDNLKNTIKTVFGFNS